MKTPLPLLFDRRVLALGVILAFAGCATAPETIPEGLVLVKDTQADVVYVRPGVDFAKYTEFYLVEPSIAFRGDWRSDMAFPGGGAVGAVSSSDVEKIIAMGKKLLAEEFDAELKKGGFKLAAKAGPGVLAVKASIADLYLEVADPNNLAGVWGSTYSKSGGTATLEIELYDSVSQELLARAHDDKGDTTDGYSWRFSRNQMSNINDARAAFSDWAQMLVNGLKRAKAAKVAAPATK